MKRKTVTVNDKMQKSFRYMLTEPIGKNFDLEFKPELTPKQMLSLGVFGGKYMTDCRKEFPALSPADSESRKRFWEDLRKAVEPNFSSGDGP